MSAAPTVAAICGSLREESYTRIACRRTLAGAEAAGGTSHLVDLREYDLPVFDADDQDAGDAPALRRDLRGADAIVLGSPMYHGSYASPLKTALDYSGFDEFEDTTVGLLGVSGGGFPITALDHLRSVCRSLDAWVIPFEAAVPNARSQFDDGTLTDPDIADRLETLGRRAVQFANIEPDPNSFESEENVGAAE